MPSSLTARSRRHSYTHPPGARSSGDRALPCGGRGRTFESCRAHLLEPAVGTEHLGFLTCRSDRECRAEQCVPALGFLTCRSDPVCEWNSVGSHGPLAGGG